MRVWSPIERITNEEEIKGRVKSKIEEQRAIASDRLPHHAPLIGDEMNEEG